MNRFLRRGSQGNVKENAIPKIFRHGLLFLVATSMQETEHIRRDHKFEKFWQEIKRKQHLYAKCQHTRKHISLLCSNIV